jgi:hypothetical protein
MWDWDAEDLETVGVRRRGGTTAGGDPIPAEDLQPVDGCVVEPLTGVELIEVTRDGATSAARVLLPITTGLDHLCDLQIRGLWYRIVGDVVAYVDDDPELSGYQVTATRGVG